MCSIVFYEQRKLWMIDLALTVNPYRVCISNCCRWMADLILTVKPYRCYRNYKTNGPNFTLKPYHNIIFAESRLIVVVFLTHFNPKTVLHLLEEWAWACEEGGRSRRRAEDDWRYRYFYQYQGCRLARWAATSPSRRRWSKRWRHHVNILLVWSVRSIWHMRCTVVLCYVIYALSALVMILRLAIHPVRLTIVEQPLVMYWTKTQFYYM